jgi:hypothetical protein
VPVREETLIDQILNVIPVKTGSHLSASTTPDRWIPAFAGMTAKNDKPLINYLSG